ncbi:MAG: glycosyltransferase family 87 protein [Chloroflexia bacterium]
MSFVPPSGGRLRLERWWNALLAGLERSGLLPARPGVSAAWRPRWKSLPRRPARRLPFHALGFRQWLNLALAVLGLFYLAFGLLYLWTGKAVNHLGVDFRTFRASAEIAWKYGFGHIYDPAKQNEFQKPWYDQGIFGTGFDSYDYAPTYYLPAFALLFLPLLLFDPRTSFYLWTGLNLLLLVLYLWRFRQALPDHLDWGILTRMVLSVPVFTSLLAGQVNVLLLIGLGEFILALIRGRDFRAGLWLAGLLLKWQVLIFFLPGLLLGRRFRVLAGFALAATFILALSVVLVGPDGLLAVGRLYLQASFGENRTINPQLMMNWRSLAANLSRVLPPALAWVPAVIGMVATAMAALSLWLRRPEVSSPSFGFVLLGTYAATCAASWHMHIYTGLPLILPLLLLYGQGRISWKTVYLWLYVPAALFPLLYLLTSELAFSLIGLTMLGLNLVLLGRSVWAVVRERGGRPPAQACFN